jgi:hypothetical protein
MTAPASMMRQMKSAIPTFWKIMFVVTSAADEPEHVGQCGTCDGICSRPATSGATAKVKLKVRSTEETAAI